MSGHTLAATPRVGLVEDDPIMGESLCARLELEGFQVTWLRSVAEARERLGRDRFDLLLLDDRLPWWATLRTVARRPAGGTLASRAASASASTSPARSSTPRPWVRRSTTLASLLPSHRGAHASTAEGGHSGSMVTPSSTRSWGHATRTPLARASARS